jgi:sugar phosphate isomerase/epimerase
MSPAGNRRFEQQPILSKIDMKKLILLAAVALASTGAWSQTSPETSSADKLGWQLAVHSYSFRKFTIFEAIDKTAALGVKYMSVSGHVLIGTNSLTTVDLPDADMEAIKARMISDGIHWPFVNIGVVELSADEAKSRKVFEFAKKWGIDTLVSEPPTNSWDTLDKLCREYNIKVAIHEHAQGHSIYWNPDTVLEAVAGRTPLMGACGDIGHWEESGLDPLDCLKKLEGRIICLHFKDNNEMGPKGHDVPWGTGVGNPKAWMEELKRQNFHGVFGIEYEYHADNPDAEMAQCVKFFNQTCDEIVAADKN